MTARALEGWTSSTLGDVAAIIMGQSPPGTTVVAWNGGASPSHGLPFLQGNAEFSAKFPVPQKWCLEPAKVAQPGDTLISVRAPVGELNLANQRLAIGRGLAAIRFTSIEPAFGWHVIAYTKKGFERLAQGSTFEAIGGDHLRKLAIYVPPLPEQRAIAAILDSIDESIERTEEVIAATEELRKALLQDLLTRGVSGWHTEWKHVPGIGTIPADWEVVRLGDVAEEFRYGTSRLSASEPVGAPVLRIPNIVRGRLDLSDLKYSEVPPSEAESTKLRDGDILVVRTNGNPTLCGRSWVVNGLTGEWYFASYLIRIRVSPTKILPNFLGLYLHSYAGRCQLSGNIRTSAGNYNLSASGLSALKVVIPPVQEQQRIVDTAERSEGLVQASESERSHLQALKRGAADALLSGRMRVPAGLEMAE